MPQCNLCPRACDVDRAGGARGFCGASDVMRVARAACHPYEEPCISGTRGSGTVFFSGCSLRCIYCQNRAISRADVGRAVTPAELCDIFLSLQEKGAHNINLVTPTHHAEGILAALELAKGKLHIPVVYNCGGYERVETLARFAGLVDVYLPDFKYISPELSYAYSAARDYAEVATAALAEMFRQVGGVRFDAAGLMTRGVLVRHLVLPGARADSVAVLDRIADTLPVGDIRLSLMRQYTPDFAPADAPAPLRRRLTSFEYDAVAAHAEELLFEGYFQSRASVGTAFTPDFDL